MQFLRYRGGKRNSYIRILRLTYILFISRDSKFIPFSWRGVGLDGRGGYLVSASWFECLGPIHS